MSPLAGRRLARAGAAGAVFAWGLAACRGSDLSREVYVPPATPTAAAPAALPAPTLARGASAASAASLPSTAAPGARATGAGVVGAEGVAAFDRLPSEARERLRGARVFFAHQSVGQNLLDGADALGFHFAGVNAGEEYGALGVRLGEGLVGRNGDPHGKVRGFLELLDQGVGRHADLAGMKLCYSDIEKPTDLGGLQTAYAAAVARVAQTHPHLKLFHVTPPLRTDEPEENKKRLAFGAFLRERYGKSAVVFDLAAVESTRPDGGRCAKDGVPVPCDAFREDHGHLTPAGARHVAKAFLYALARALDT